jgi:hypothetical protein
LEKDDIKPCSIITQKIFSNCVVDQESGNNSCKFRVKCPNITMVVSTGGVGNPYPTNISIKTTKKFTYRELTGKPIPAKINLKIEQSAPKNQKIKDTIPDNCSRSDKYRIKSFVLDCVNKGGTVDECYKAGVKINCRNK